MAGTVALGSSDPLDTPEIVYNYFDTGSGEYEKDLKALTEALQLARSAFEEYIKDSAWGHHVSCTCPIGPDDALMAVLDSKFCVRRVKGLRVVDASVYPKTPGTFTAVSTYMVAEKAAGDILAGLTL
ncbi:GMC oxidoreductase-domain-containing protein [Lasiosphaeris hirsuta]|uniref:GMC oxidoreductase-domain-containing protein n=1 Tax=Lasiosphaeris hirsuta TaxID=260670 RepID=A0AA40AP81_9PEZI|nr:GMC oxidoreductase-domain-containing protein [Lasiosphaeris hirsuta]